MGAISYGVKKSAGVLPEGEPLKIIMIHKLLMHLIRAS
jgi:hypothetical protein